MRSICLALAALLLVPGVSHAAPPTAADLLLQVRAEEAMGEFIATRSQEVDAEIAALAASAKVDQTPSRPETGRQRPRLSYDLAIKAAREVVADAGPADPQLAQLNGYELQHELAVLRSENLRAYLELNRKLEAAENKRGNAQTTPTTAPSPDSPEGVKRKLREITRPNAKPKWKRPENSLLLSAPQPPAPGEGWGTQPTAFADQPRTATEEGPPSGENASSPAAVARTVSEIMSGKPLPGAFAVPSALAPTNARMPGSLPWNPPLAWTFSLPGDTPWTQSRHADPPGTASGIRPSPEVVARLSSALSISAEQATDLAMGRISMVDLAQQRAGGDTITSGITLTPSDPRWGAYYYGPGQARNGWNDGADSFTFQSGGGTYIRSDTRVNQNSDSRTNASFDRRVNSSNDRRVNVQIDPRANP